MINRELLKKAEDLKKDLIIKEVCLEGSDRILNDNDEIVFDFKNHYVGYLTVDFSCTGHHQDAPLYFQIQFAEVKQELEQKTENYNGWISRSWIQEERIHIDILPRSYSFERRYAFRYVKIRILATSENYSVRVDGLKARTVSSADYRTLYYPSFSEEDRRLDEVSVRTLHSCMQDVFEDGPKRDRRLWLGDLRLEALTNYETFRNYDLVKRCLYLFAGTTLEEGRLASNLFIEPEVECDYQTMFDYTLFYICTLWNYYENTEDLETLEDLEPVCYRQYELLKECFTDDILDVSQAGNIFIDWNFDLDKQAAGQAIYIYALRDLLKMEKILHKGTEELETEITRKAAAAKNYYDESLGLFVSGKEKQASYASQIWMILADVVNACEGRKLLERLSGCKDAVGMNSPYAYHHYIDALIHVGLKEEAYRKMHEYWDGMIRKGTDTFWEIYNPADEEVSPYGSIVVHSFCHAWSCTPAYFLRKYFY